VTLSYPSGSVNVSLDVQIVDDSGIAVTGLVAATFPPVSLSAGVGADVSLTLSDLASLSAAHADAGIKERGGGVYRLDIPDQSDGTFTLRGEQSGKHLIAPKVQFGNVPSAIQIAAELSGQSTIVVTSPVISVGPDGLPVKIEIVQGADYLIANGQQIDLTLSGTLPEWTGAAVHLDIRCGANLSLTGTVVTATGATRKARFEMTKTQSATLIDTAKANKTQDIGLFDLRVILADSSVTVPVSESQFVSRRRAI